jgi:lysophospholipase L1-like esterase
LFQATAWGRRIGSAFRLLTVASLLCIGSLGAPDAGARRPLAPSAAAPGPWLRAGTAGNGDVADAQTPSHAGASAPSQTTSLVASQALPAFPISPTSQPSPAAPMSPTSPMPRVSPASPMSPPSVSVEVTPGPVAPSPTPRTFVVLGDSLSAWAFPPDSPYHNSAGTWPSLLAAQDPGLVLVNNAGVPGNTTSQMLARMQRDVLDYDPDILFVLGGTNDVGTGVPDSVIVANITRIVETAQAHGISVVLLTIPPDDDDYAYHAAARRAINADLATLARKEKAGLVDAWAALATADGTLAEEFAAFDGLHLTERGEQALADAVQRVLDRTPEPRPT